MSVVVESLRHGVVAPALSQFQTPLSLTDNSCVFEYSSYLYLSMNALMTRNVLTMQQYRQLPEPTRAELIGNVLHEPPAPLYEHQHTLVEIACGIRAFINHDPKNGTLVIAPFDVYLDESANAVQPDVVLILPGNPGRLDGSFYGVPDFIVEILSPGNCAHDQKTKLELYEKFKVKEYWIVDPGSRFVQGYSLKQSRFVALPPATGKIESGLINTSMTF